MKILIVRTFPNIIDPSSYNIQEIGLAKALTRKGHECGIVLYYGKNEDTIEKTEVVCEDEKREITIYRLHGFSLLKNGFFPSLHKIIKEYDIIQVHEYDQITSWLYYAWSKKPVVIYHGPYEHPFNKGYNLKCKIFDRTFLKFKQKKDTMCLTKSHAAAEFLKNRKFLNVTAVGVGLDAENFTKAGLAEDLSIPIPEEKFNLIYVGKIEERRNPDFLLEIFEKVCAINDRINTIIIGNGEREYTKCFLEKAQKLIRSGKLQYYPKASQAQLADVYRKSQLMVFPTNYDIFGMVLLEAFYYDLPVISSQNGGADMLLSNGKNGIFMEDFSSENWVGAIDELSRNRNKYQEMKQYLANRGKEYLLWDAKAEEFVRIYEKAIQLKN